VRATNGVVGAVALDAKTTVLAASGGKTTSLSVLVDRVNDPVDSGVVADSEVLGIDKDDLVVLVGGILVNPVGVEDAKVVASTTSTLLGNGAEVADELELVDTLILGLTVDDTLVVGSLAATTADGDTVEDVSLENKSVKHKRK
jgi:hypothetical protein